MQLPHPIKQHKFSYFIVPCVNKTELWNYWPALLYWLSVALNMDAARLTCITLESSLSPYVEVNVILRTANMFPTQAERTRDRPQVFSSKCALIHQKWNLLISLCVCITELDEEGRRLDDISMIHVFMSSLNSCSYRDMSGHYMSRDMLPFKWPIC